MIKVSALTKSFPGRDAVRDVSFEVSPGKIVGFLGPNGAGKTTTLRMITGYVEPTRGQIEVAGVDAVAEPQRARRHLGYMPEGVPMYDEMRVSEYLRFRAAIKGVPRAKIADSVERSLDQASVSDAVDRIVGQLSKGYRQRIGLADTLLSDPPLLILDEPTSGLDPNQIRAVRKLIRSFRGKKTVFLSTHILPEVEASCDEVIVIHEGQVVRQSGIAELKKERSGESSLELVARCPGEASEASLRSALEALEGAGAVRALRIEGDLLSARIVVASEGAVEPLSEQVFELCVAKGLVLRKLSPMAASGAAASLEKVFASLTLESPEDADDTDTDNADADEEASR